MRAVPMAIRPAVEVARRLYFQHHVRGMQCLCVSVYLCVCIAIDVSRDTHQINQPRKYMSAFLVFPDYGPEFALARMERSHAVRFLSLLLADHPEFCGCCCSRWLCLISNARCSCIHTYTHIHHWSVAHLIVCCGVFCQYTLFNTSSKIAAMSYTHNICPPRTYIMQIYIKVYQPPPMCATRA